MDISQIDEEMETNIDLPIPEGIEFDADNDPMLDASDDWDQDLMQEGSIEEAAVGEVALQDDDMLDEENTGDGIVSMTEDADVDVTQGDDTIQEDEDILYEEDEPINLGDRTELRDPKLDATTILEEHYEKSSEPATGGQESHTQDLSNHGVAEHRLADEDLRNLVSSDSLKLSSANHSHSAAGENFSESAQGSFDHVQIEPEEDLTSNTVHARDFVQGDLQSSVNLQQESHEDDEAIFSSAKNTGHTEGFDDASAHGEGDNKEAPSSPSRGENEVTTEPDPLLDDPAPLADEEIENFAGVNEPDPDLDHDSPQGDQSYTQLHPVKVHYQDTEISLFPSHEDGAETYFLQDEEVAYKSLDKMLASCRDVLVGSIGDHDEVVIDIPVLGLHISEGSVYAGQISLSQIIDVYLLLSRNSGIDDIEPLRCVLYTRICLTSQYAYILSSAREGKKIDQLLASFELSDLDESAAAATSIPKSVENHSKVNGHETAEERATYKVDQNVHNYTDEEIEETKGKTIENSAEKHQDLLNEPHELEENNGTDLEHESHDPQLAEPSHGGLALAEEIQNSNDDANTKDILIDEELGSRSEHGDSRQLATSSRVATQSPRRIEESSKTQDSTSSHTLEADSPQHWTAEDEEDLFDEGNGNDWPSQIESSYSHPALDGSGQTLSAKSSDSTVDKDLGKVGPAIGGPDTTVPENYLGNTEAQNLQVNDRTSQGQDDESRPRDNLSNATSEAVPDTANDIADDTEGILDYDFEEIAIAADESEEGRLEEKPKVSSSSSLIPPQVVIDQDIAQKGETIDIQDFDFVEVDSEALEQKMNSETDHQSLDEDHIDGSADHFENTHATGSTPRSSSKRKVPAVDDNFPLIEVDSPNPKRTRSS